MDTAVKFLLAFLLLLPLGACVTTGGTTGSLCPVGPFVGDPGAAQRLTRAEKEYVTALNRAGEELCGWTAPKR